MLISNKETGLTSSNNKYDNLFSFYTGAGMFVTTIVVGAVVISKPFTLTRRPYMRDLIFYLAAVYWTFFVLWENRMNIWISLGEWAE